MVFRAEVHQQRALSELQDDGFSGLCELTDQSKQGFGEAGLKEREAK